MAVSGRTGPRKPPRLAEAVSGDARTPVVLENQLTGIASINGSWVQSTRTERSLDGAFRRRSLI